MRDNRGFTLVEIMIVVSIIALLAAIVMPSFLVARQRTQNTKVVNCLRIATDAFVMYAADHNRYPDGAAAGQIPPGMDMYLQKMRWTAATPVGGNWQWQGDKSGGSVTIFNPTASFSQMKAIDAMVDDGNESTGTFRITGNHWKYIVE
jgi:prepilin-type N-terminal cleavage/methylation domain-containing protein